MTNETILPLLQSYYSQTFTERMDARINALICLNNGWESEVYAFRVEWGTADQRQFEDLILRIYPGADAVKKSSGEYRALTLLKQAGYPVPRVDYLEQAKSPFDRPFLIMEAIHGRSMWKLMFHSDPGEQQRYLVQFCRLFSQLHAIDWRRFVPDPGEYETGYAFGIIERQINNWLPIFEALPLPGFQFNMNWLFSHQHDFPSQHASLVHWDFHPDNILIKENGEAVVIDWTGLDISDYRFDLAWSLLLLTSVEGNQWREPLLLEYERQAGQRVEGMEFFNAAACIRRLYSVAVSMRYGADKLGMRPGAEKEMIQHAKPLRHVYEQLLAITGFTIPEIETFLNTNGA